MSGINVSLDIDDLDRIATALENIERVLFWRLPIPVPMPGAFSLTVVSQVQIGGRSVMLPGGIRTLKRIDTRIAEYLPELLLP